MTTPMKVADLGVIYDGPHATPTRQDTGNKYFLNISSLESGRLNLDLSDYVNDEDYARWTRRVTPRGGDLLFSYETRLGDAALMPPNVEACLGRRMALLRPAREVADPRFLLYFWLSPVFQAEIAARAIHGATVSRISLKSLADWPVVVPSLRQQRAIGEVLGALDDKIAANRRLLTVGQELLLARWEGMTRERGEVAMASVMDVNPRTAAPAKDGAPFLDMKNLPQSGMLVESIATRAAGSGTRFRQHDTLLARITPCFENGKSGLVDFLDEDEVGFGSTEYIVFRPKPGIPAAAPYCAITMTTFRAEAERAMTGTSGRQRVQPAPLAASSIPWPAQDDLADFGALSDALLARMGRARDENQVLAATRDELLPLLMDGRITVKGAEKVVEEVV